MTDLDKMKQLQGKRRRKKRDKEKKQGLLFIILTRSGLRFLLKMSIFRLTQRVIFSTLCISTVTSIQLFMVDTTFSIHLLVIAFFSAAITIYLLMAFADQSASGKVQPRYKLFKADTKSFFHGFFHVLFAFQIQQESKVLSHHCCLYICFQGARFSCHF